MTVKEVAKVTLIVTFLGNCKQAKQAHIIMFKRYMYKAHQSSVNSHQTSKIEAIELLIEYTITLKWFSFSLLI